LIVLHVTVGPEQTEIRSPRARLVLGSSAKADVRRRDAGWRGQEAVFRHAGTAVVVERPGRKGSATIRVGDVVHLGDARVALVGLLPMRTPSRPATPAAGVVFGGYEEALAAPPPLPAPTEAPVVGAGAAAPALAAPRHPPGPLFPEQDFGRDMLAALKKSPFFAASAAIHVLLFLLLSLIPAPRTGHAHDEGALQVALAGVREPFAPLEREEDPLPSLPEMAMVPIPDPPTLDEPTEKPPAKTEVPELVDIEDPVDAPTTMGPTPSLRAAGSRVAKRLPRPSRVDPTEQFSRTDAAAVNARTAEIVRAQIGVGDGTRGKSLDELAKTDLLVVDGAFDHVGRVLGALRMPYLLVRPWDLAASDAPALGQHKVIFWNCGEGLPPDKAARVARRIRSYVADGGYLFTTDWAVGNLLADAFPGMVTTLSNAKIGGLPEAVVEIQPTEAGRDHPLLEGVFDQGVSGRWWLEQSSFDVVVQRPEDVTVLIESPDLEKYFRRSPAVAVTFAHGRGRVLHVMGHYFQEAGNVAGTIAAQRLALNFVLQRLRNP
jgi:hypothetical protein